MATPHIESKLEDISKYIIMPGDPKRAEYIATNYLEDYKLVNSVRGITAFTGFYKGKKITVFPSGMGNPSMGIYSYELMNEYNAEVLIRIGTMGAYTTEIKPFDIVVASSVYSVSNYGLEQTGEKEEIINCNNELLEAVRKHTNKVDFQVKEGRVHTTDSFYGKVDYENLYKEKETLGVEMETFALYTNAKQSNKKALSLLTVTDHFVTGEKLTSEERVKNVDAMVYLALETIISL